MADDPNNRDERRLPWPEASDPALLGHAVERPATREDRALGSDFERANESDELEMGREFSDPHYADRHRLARAFADPNALDAARLGKSFEETNSSRKKKKAPIAERVHKPVNRRPLYWTLAAFALVLIIVVLSGWLPRHFRDEDLRRRADAEKNAKPQVEVMRVGNARNNEPLIVPGTTIPLTEAYVYARANGYLRSLKVDIGDHVVKGQLLAVIDAPDLDAQVAQAKQQLLQADQQLENQKSQLALQKVTVERYRVLVVKGVISRQQGDQQETNYAAQVANVAAAQRNVDAFKANLDRVIALQSYEQVRAPFTGVVTQRNVDIGALISAQGAASGGAPGPAPQGQTSVAGGTTQAAQANNGGSSGNINTSATPAQSPGQGGPLFGIADTTRLRILVSVPEGYAPAIHPGAHAQLSMQEFPNTQFIGDITRTSNSIDPNTRTLLTEIQIDNHNGKLIPGMYTVVKFPPVIGGGEAPLTVSGDAIVVRHDTTSVATVVNGRVRFVPVTIGRDFGNAVEILTGLKAGDIVITNVTDQVTDNRQVQAQFQQTNAEQTQPPQSQNTPLGGTTQYGNQGITDQNLQGKQSQQNQKSQGNGAQKGNGTQQRNQSESRP